MKRAESFFIHQVLTHIRSGTLVGEAGSTGPAVLKHLEAVLEAIQDGADVDTALGITRRDGPASDEFLDDVAELIHAEIKAGTKQVVITHLMAELYAANGRQPVTWTALRKAYMARLPDIERREAVAEMIDRFNRPGT